MTTIPDKTFRVPEHAFNDIYIPYLGNNKRTQIYYGGSSSGKSVFLSQRTVKDVLRNIDGGRNYLVCRQIARTIRGSVFTEICKVINDWGIGNQFSINKSDMLITCANGYQIIFAGLDEVEKLKSLVPAKGVITDIWIEEATEIDKNTLKQLYKRQRGGDESIPKRLTMSFNPILRTHWIYEDYFKTISWSDNQKEYQGEGLSILKTTYKDNKFLTSEDKKDLENEKDKYYYDVYTMGNWGILGHVIFTNIKIEDLSGMKDEWTNRKHGLDFGYSSDPAALIVSHYDSKKKIVYLYDELYETGLTNDVLADELKKKIGIDRVACDSAEPKSIAELWNYGVSAYAVKKGKDSVLHGIQWLQQQTIIIDSKCINAKNELTTYHWKEDAGGNALPVPIDKNDHLVDGLRYAYEDEGGWYFV